MKGYAFVNRDKSSNGIVQRRKRMEHYEMYWLQKLFKVFIL